MKTFLAIIGGLVLALVLMVLIIIFLPVIIVSIPFIVAIFIIISPVIVVVIGIKSAITKNKKEGEIYE